MIEIIQFSVAALATLVLALMVRRGLIWSKGKAAQVQCGGLHKIPKRYFDDVHHKVQQRPGAAQMHILIAGGGLALVLVSLAAVVISNESRVIIWLMRLFAIATLIGAVLDLTRRLPYRRFALSNGAWLQFPVFLGLLATGVGAATFVPSGAPTAYFWTGPSVVAIITIPLGLLGLFSMPVLAGPLKHAFAGAMHLAYHPRPERFGDGDGIAPASLMPCDVSKEPIGTPTFADMNWNRLLSFDACVECGRCEEVCPAFAAGQPLNPKALIQDLARGSSGESVARNYAGSPHPGRLPYASRQDFNAPIIGGLVSADTLWSCTTCRACVESCPMFIEHVDTIVDFRRSETLEHGAAPEGAERVLRNLRETSTPTGDDQGKKGWWARNAGVPLLSEVGRTDVLLWIGDTVHDERTRATLLGLVELLRDAEVDFAVLGDDEGDTGDLARRLGDEVTFLRLATRNRDVLAKSNFKRIVTTDPHVMHCLRNEYPALGVSFEVMHHSDFLNRLVDDGQLKLKNDIGWQVTYHDPCYLGRYNREFEAPRALLTRVGADLHEMTRSGANARCCGGGGGTPYSDIPGQRRISDMRMQDAHDIGAKTLVVGCPNCRSMLDGASAGTIEVVDLIDILLAAREKTDA